MSTVHDMNNTFDNLNGGNESTNHGRGEMWMTTWIAMVSSRDRPREGARGAQRTYRGGSRWMITWMAMVGSRDRPREGARGAQRTYRGGPEEGYRRETAFPHRCRCDLRIT